MKVAQQLALGLTIGADRKMKQHAYFKIPTAQSDRENCVSHNGSLVPVPGRDISVQGWYQGGVNVIDFTDPTNPIEIAWFDRGPLSDSELYTGASATGNVVLHVPQGDDGLLRINAGMLADDVFVAIK